LDSSDWGNLTFNDQKQDAEKALDVLIQQPEVDANRITVLGHSEGTIIIPRIAVSRIFSGSYETSKLRSTDSGP
jgi:hypothetical protein